MSTSWTRDFGLTQGRIAPTEITAPEGSYVFCLGASDHRVEDLYANDFIKVEQDADFNATGAMRCKIRVRAPSVMPTGLKWEWAVAVDGDEAIVREITRDRDYNDVVLPLADWVLNNGGSGAISFTLRLVDDGFGTSDYQAVELPAVYVDELIFFDEAEALFQGNRQAEPNEVRVGKADKIELVLYDLTGGDFPLYDDVYVNGVLAFNGVTLEPGFDGPDSETPFIDGFNGIHLTLDPTTDFASEQVVEVRVTGHSNVHDGTIDETFLFTIEDYAPPTIVRAEGRAPRVVRVFFSEAMLLDDTENHDSALWIGNWVFEGVSVPTAEVQAESVAAVSSSSVDVTTNTELSFGGIYRVTVESAQDVSGNVIGDPNSAELVAFVPSSPPGRSFNFFDLMPEINRTQDESGDLKKFCDVIQDLINLLLYDIDNWVSILDPTTAPEDVVDAMLEDLGNPFPFAFDLSHETKVRLVLILVEIYRQKGTKPGIENAIRFFLSIDVEVVEWYEEWWDLGIDEIGEIVIGSDEQHDIYSWEIHSPVVLTDQEESLMTQIGTYMMPAHTHLRAIIQPTPPEVIDHLELGASELGGTEWSLHE